jgi:hypothetical protein
MSFKCINCDQSEGGGLCRQCLEEALENLKINLSVSPFLYDVEHELDKARHHHKPIHSLHEGYAVILEELEEVKAEIFKKSPSRAAVYHELLQTAAMCQRTAEDVLSPIKGGE